MSSDKEKWEKDVEEFMYVVDPNGRDIMYQIVKQAYEFVRMLIPDSNGGTKHTMYYKNYHFYDPMMSDLALACIEDDPYSCAALLHGERAHWEFLSQYWNPLFISVRTSFRCFKVLVRAGVELGWDGTYPNNILCDDRIDLKHLDFLLQHLGPKKFGKLLNTPLHDSPSSVPIATQARMNIVRWMVHQGSTLPPTVIVDKKQYLNEVVFARLCLRKKGIVEELIHLITNYL